MLDGEDPKYLIRDVGLKKKVYRFNDLKGAPELLFQYSVVANSLFLGDEEKKPVGKLWAKLPDEFVLFPGVAQADLEMDFDRIQTKGGPVEQGDEIFDFTYAELLDIYGRLC